MNLGICKLAGAKVAHGKVVVGVGVIGLKGPVLPEQGHGLGGLLFLHQLFAEVKAGRGEILLQFTGFPPEALGVGSISLLEQEGCQRVPGLGVAGITLDDLEEESPGIGKILQEEVALCDGGHDFAGLAGDRVVLNLKGEGTLRFVGHLVFDIFLNEDGGFRAIRMLEPGSFEGEDLGK